MTPPKKEVVKEVEKEENYVTPPPYKPPIHFSYKFMEANVGTQSNRYVEIMDKILTNAPLTKVQSKKRILEDYETGKIIDVKREMLNFEVGDERIKSKLEKLILRIEP